jgi:integrase
VRATAKDLDALVAAWKEDRDVKGMRSAERAYGQYHKHISPRLGKRPPDTVRPQEVCQVLQDAYGGLSAKSVRNLRATLSGVYTFGCFQELCETNPCREIPKSELPALGKQKRPVYDDIDAPRLMAHESDEPEWRVFYCLEGLAGLRSGEAAGRRWRDLDWDSPGLASLRVSSQYQDQPLKTSSGDDSKERLVPVHPDLAVVLRSWKLSGFARRYGRHPKPDDFICPDVRTMLALTPGKVSKRPPKHCAALGIPSKGNHGLRRHFITYARRGGARADMLERVTHNSSGDIIDVYTDADGIWPALCEAVSCLKVSWPQDKVVRLPVAVSVGRDTLRDTAKTRAEEASKNRMLLAPAVGLEPTTKRLTAARSTD